MPRRGVPSWWPRFCLTFDLVGAYLAWLLGFPRVWRGLTGGPAAGKIVTDRIVTFGCRGSRSRCARGTVSVLPVLISTLPRHFDNAPLPGAFMFLGYQNSADITRRRGYRGPSRHGLSCNPRHRSPAALRAAARLIGLYRGTGNRPVRTEHAAVPRLGPQQRTAACTVVEVDARIRRHALTRDMSTVRTGQFGGRDQRL